MSRVQELIAKQRQLEEDLKLAMEEERDAVVADVRDKIKRFNITATELKGLIKGRVTQKQVEEFLKRKESLKSKPKAAAKKATK
jgi:sulfur relay (sulfurtransferase) DsrC/TusE family protein